MTAGRAVPGPQKRLLALLLILLLAAQIDQPYPEVALLQHIPTLLLLVASPWLLRRWPLSTASLACIALFMALHTLGGRYAYSNVPYDDWVRALTGSSLSDACGGRATIMIVSSISPSVRCRSYPSPKSRGAGAGWAGAAPP